MSGQHMMDLEKELQATGLYAFAAMQGYSGLGNNTFSPEATLIQAKPAVKGPRSSMISPQHLPQAGMPQPQAATGVVPAGAGPSKEQMSSQVNQHADTAASRAQQVLHATQMRLQNLVHSYAPHSTTSGATDGSAKRRKTSRGGSATAAASDSAGRAGGKGLRHFSMKVCEKVESKVRTTYNEVADELVAELSKIDTAEVGMQYDEKNIRRRVYDAINVLMAMDIIQKEKKEIMWKGFPAASGSSVDRLKAERLNKIKEIEQKQAMLADRIEQQRASMFIINKNASRDTSQIRGTQLHPPFVLIQAKPDATVEVKISDDMTDIQFDFYQSPFQIHDDSYVTRSILAQAQQMGAQGTPAGHGQWQLPAAAAGPHSSLPALTNVGETSVGPSSLQHRPTPQHASAPPQPMQSAAPQGMQPQAKPLQQPPQQPAPHQAARMQPQQHHQHMKHHSMHAGPPFDGASVAQLAMLAHAAQAQYSAPPSYAPPPAFYPTGPQLAPAAAQH